MRFLRFPRCLVEGLILLWLVVPASALTTSNDIVFPERGSSERMHLRKPVADICGGVNHTLVLYRDGTVDAWGLNCHGQCEVPSGLKEVVAISAGSWTSAALCRDGRIFMWGEDAPVIDPAVRGKWISCPPQSYSDFAAVLADGTLKIWGDEPELKEWAATVTDAIQVGWTFDGVVVLREGGGLVSFPPDGIKVPKERKDFVQLRAGSYSSAAITRTGEVFCFGENGAPVPSRQVVHHAAANENTILLLADGTLQTRNCWEKSAEPWVDLVLPAWAKEAIPIAVAGGEWCVYVIFKDGSVWASGWDHAGQAALTTTPKKAVKLVSGFQNLLLRSDGTVACWPEGIWLGFTGYGLCPIGLKGNDIAAGATFNLVLLENGKVMGWGSGVDQCRPPEELENVIAVAASGNFSMALKDDGKVMAWGENDEGQCEVPEDLPPISRIAAGDEFGLALGKNGEVFSWGKLPGAPVGIGGVRVTAISAGRKHAMALGEDGRVFVWGGGDQPPGGLPKIVAIAAGGDRSGVITEDGRAIVWGEGSALPKNTAPLESLACGEAGMFGITRTGELVSWGWEAGDSPLNLTGMIPVGILGDSGK